MPEWLSSIFGWLAGRSPLLVYGFLFFNAALESIFPPYPSDGIVLVIAFAAGGGGFNPYLVYLFTVLGSFAGVMAIYWLGRHRGRSLVLLTRVFSPKHIDQTEQVFHRWGDAIVLLNRFLPGLRAPICFVAGMSRVRPVKMALYSAASIAVWNAILIPIGYAVGSNWQRASQFLKHYNIAAWLVILVPLLVFLGVYLLKKYVVAPK